MGSSAVVIGCTGVTEAMCRVLLEQGAAHVGIISGDVENLCATRERLADDRVITFHANLRRRDQVEHAMELFRTQAGQLDLVVNNAGLLASDLRRPV